MTELLDEIITDLEQLHSRLAKLHEGLPARFGNSEPFQIKHEGLAPALDKLNEVIRDLKGNNQ